MATNPDPKGGKFLGPYIDPSITVSPPVECPDSFGAQKVGAEASINPSLAVSGVSPVPALPGSKIPLRETRVYRPAHADGVNPGGTSDYDSNAATENALILGCQRSPNSWRNTDVTIPAEGAYGAQHVSYQRDPYRIEGMTGQNFLNNKGNPAGT